jgi:hypothetical protein
MNGVIANAKYASNLVISFADSNPFQNLALAVGQSLARPLSGLSYHRELESLVSECANNIECLACPF